VNGVIICRGYGLDASIRRFWSGRRWVVDPSDAELYQGNRWMAECRRLRAKNTTDRDIVGVSNYGLVDEQKIAAIGLH
jgi:hypothetical protein